MSLKAFLASIVAPKTLTEAKGSIDQAKAKMTAVGALFEAAGLDLDTMLAAGPGALESHLVSLSAKDTDLAAATAKATDLEGKLTAKTGELTALQSTHAAFIATLATAGITATATTTPEQFSAAFASHAKKQAAQVLAGTGHPPVPHTPAGGAAGTPEGAMKRADFSKLTPRQQSDFSMLVAAGKASLID